MCVARRQTTGSLVYGFGWVPARFYMLRINGEHYGLSGLGITAINGGAYICNTVPTDFYKSTHLVTFIIKGQGTTAPSYRVRLNGTELTFNAGNPDSILAPRWALKDNAKSFSIGMADDTFIYNNGDVEFAEAKLFPNELSAGELSAQETQLMSTYGINP